MAQRWLEIATCERGFSVRTQILTAQRYSMGDSLRACLMMIVSNGPSCVWERGYLGAISYSPPNLKQI
jgi:hypothetical protein